MAIEVNAFTLYFGLWALFLSVSITTFNIACGEAPKGLKSLVWFCLAAMVVCDIFSR